MYGRFLWFSLFLPFPGPCMEQNYQAETKIILKESGVISVCPNKTMDEFIMAHCTISRVRRKGRECILPYRTDTHQTTSTCNSTLTIQNNTNSLVFHLANPTASDEGNYTCQCTYSGGTDILRSSISVDESNSIQNMPGLVMPFYVLVAVIAIASAVVLITVAGGVVYVIHRRVRKTRAQISGVTTAIMPLQNMTDDDPGDSSVYTSLSYPDNNIYSSVSETSGKPRPAMSVTKHETMDPIPEMGEGDCISACCQNLEHKLRAIQNPVHLHRIQFQFNQLLDQYSRM